MSDIINTDILLFVTSTNADYKVINRFFLVTSDLLAEPGADYQLHVKIEALH